MDSVSLMNVKALMAFTFLFNPGIKIRTHKKIDNNKISNIKNTAFFPSNTRAISL